MIFELERFAYTPMGTFGRLRCNGFEAYTIEEVWNNNKPFGSCIPCGIYPMRRGRFPKHGEAFEIQHVPNRDFILIHVANTIDDIEGCVGPGNSLGMQQGRTSKKMLWSVNESGLAYARFMKFMEGTDEAKIRIYNYTGGIL